ncbi:MAG: MFS transporter [Actinomycetales bacterium]|nr:MFS transporter [Actinomycetales bacterium]
MSTDAQSASGSVAWRRVVLWAGIPLIIGALNEFALLVSIPAVRAEFGLELHSVGWMVLAFLIADAAVLIAAGRLGDRIGRRRIAVTGLSLVVVGSLLCAVTPSFQLLILGRVIEGFGVGAVFSGLLAIIVDSVPAQSRGRAFGLWALIGACSVLVSPMVGGLLAEHGSWRWIFVLNALISVVALLTARRYVSAAPQPSAPAEAKPARLVTSANYVAGTAVTTLVYATCGLVWLAVVYFLVMVLGFGLTTAGVMFASYGVWWLLLPPFTGRFADRIGVRTPIIIGAALCVIGCATLALAATTQSVLAIAAALSVMGIGLAFVVPSANSATMGNVPPQIRGQASGINMTARIIGSIAGVSVTVAFVNSLDAGDVALSAQLVWGLAAALMVLALLITAFGIRRVTA